jgi:hypothetical protein
MREVAAEGIREIIQSRLGAAHVEGLLNDLIAPPRHGENYPSPLRWRQRGFGVGTEMKRAFSNIFGRFFARWYLAKHHGFTFFAPINDSPTRISNRLVIERTAGVYLPDWVCAKPGALSLAESKGSSATSIRAAYTAQPLRQAEIQLTSTQVMVQDSATLQFTRRRVKGWGVMTRWATEQDRLRPLIFALDPETEGEPMREDETDSCVNDVQRRHYYALLSGIGHSDLAKRILADDVHPDEAYLRHYASSPNQGIETSASVRIQPETIRLNGGQIGAKSFVGAVVDTRGRVVEESVGKIVDKMGQIPAAILDGLFFVGVDQEIIEDLVQ